MKREFVVSRKARGHRKDWRDEDRKKLTANPCGALDSPIDSAAARHDLRSRSHGEFCQINIDYCLDNSSGSDLAKKSCCP